MTDQELQECLNRTESPGCDAWSREDIPALVAEARRLREALHQARCSLLALSLAGSRYGTDLWDMIDVRGYAANRASVATEALDEQKP